jgi:hypothetical protein
MTNTDTVNKAAPATLEIYFDLLALVLHQLL